MARLTNNMLCLDCQMPGYDYSEPLPEEAPEGWFEHVARPSREVLAGLMAGCATRYLASTDRLILV